MTGFDILVLIVVGVSAVLAFARGFVREVFSMIALVAGVLAAVWCLPFFRDSVRQLMQPDWMADTTLVVCVFLLVYIAVRVLTGRIHEWIHDSEPLGLLDRTAGILFGVLRGFAIASVPILLLNSVAKKEESKPSFVTQSRFYPFLSMMGDALSRLTPNATASATNLAKGAASAGEEAAKWQDNAQMLNDATNAINEGKIPSFEKSDQSEKQIDNKDEAKSPKSKSDHTLKVEKK